MAFLSDKDVEAEPPSKVACPAENVENKESKSDSKD